MRVRALGMLHHTGIPHSSSSTTAVQYHRWLVVRINSPTGRPGPWNDASILLEGRGRGSELVAASFHAPGIVTSRLLCLSTRGTA